jgi:hypothetical protein
MSDSDEPTEAQCAGGGSLHRSTLSLRPGAWAAAAPSWENCCRLSAMLNTEYMR